MSSFANTTTKKRGRKKKEKDGEIAETSTPKENSTRISFGKTDIVEKEASGNKKSLSFGGLNITVHAAKKTDVRVLAKNLRFGSKTADKKNESDSVIHGETEPTQAIISTPSRMCEIVEHDSDEEPDEPEQVEQVKQEKKI